MSPHSIQVLGTFAAVSLAFAGVALAPSPLPGAALAASGTRGSAREAGVETVRALVQGGRGREALDLAVDLHAKGFHDRDLRILVGEALLDAGEPTLAAEALLRVRPLDATVRRPLGLALVRSRRYAEGGEALRSLTGWREDAEVAFHVALAHRGAGDLEAAEAILAALRRREPYGARAAAELSRIHVDPSSPATFDPGAALREARTAAAAGLPCHDALAAAHLAAGDAAGARAAVDACLADGAAPPEVRSSCLAVLERLDRRPASREPGAPAR